jgi:hypothetical protein
LATLWIIKYAEGAIVTGRRGTIAVSFSAGGLHPVDLLHLLAARGFTLRSQRVEVGRDSGIRVTCNGRYRGAYPDWSSELVRELAARPDVSHVEWADSD